MFINVCYVNFELQKNFNFFDLISFERQRFFMRQTLKNSKVFQKLHNVSGPGPGPVPVLGLFSVEVPVISGPDDWSRSRSHLNFGPGTSPGPDSGPMAWLLKYSY